MNNPSFVLFAAAEFFPHERAIWLYLAGFVILAVGLPSVLGTEARQTKGVDKFIPFGPLFLAFPMGIFAGDHFIAANNIATLVPSWIPGHLFWAYFVGVALFAAALSIAVNRYAVLASSLLAGMLFSFVLLLHVPNLRVVSSNRFVLIILLRDLSFSAGALAFAVGHARPPWKAAGKLTVLIRLAIAIAAVVFGVENVLYPQFVPVIPLEQPMPSWIPAHPVIAYVTGLVLVTAGLSLLVNWKSRLAATWLGIFVLVIVVLVYLPITVASPSDIENGLNYVADTLVFSGAALLLAGILPKEHAAEPVPSGEATASPAETGNQA